MVFQVSTLKIAKTYMTDDTSANLVLKIRWICVPVPVIADRLLITSAKSRQKFS